MKATRGRPLSRGRCVATPCNRRRFADQVVMPTHMPDGARDLLQSCAAGATQEELSQKLSALSKCSKCELGEEQVELWQSAVLGAQEASSRCKKSRCLVPSAGSMTVPGLHQAAAARSELMSKASAGWRSAERCRPKTGALRERFASLLRSFCSGQRAPGGAVSGLITRGGGAAADVHTLRMVLNARASMRVLQALMFGGWGTILAWELGPSE
eukprot:s1542_g1.t1